MHGDGVGTGTGVRILRVWKCYEEGLTEKLEHEDAFIAPPTTMQFLVIQQRKSIKVHGSVSKNVVWPGQTILPDLT